MGPLFAWLLPFLVIGFCISAYRFFFLGIRFYGFLLWWFFCGFIANSLSYEGTNVQRTLLVLPAVLLFCSVGLYESYIFIQRRTFNSVLSKSFSVLCCLLGVFGFVYFYDSYFIRQAVHQPWVRQSYGKEFIQKLDTYASQYPKTVSAYSPYMVFLYYRHVDPIEAQKLLAHKGKIESGIYTIDHYKNVQFMPRDCPNAGQLTVLYVCNGDEIPLNSHVVDVVRYPGGVPARVFIMFDPPSSSYILDKGFRIGILKDTRSQQKLLPSGSDALW